MTSSALATNLLGRRVRLHEVPPELKTDTGKIATVYIEGRELHYVLLVGGRLVHVENAAQFTVLEDRD